MAPIGKYAVVAALVGLSAFGFRATVGTMTRNGMGGVLRTALAEGATEPIVAGSPGPLKRSFVGVAAADRQLAILVAFFAALIDDAGAGWDAVAFYVWGMAQFAAAWTAVVLEGRRAGNRGRHVLPWVGTLGLVFQNLTWTFTVPLYLALHLLTSPVARIGDGGAGAAAASRKQVGEAGRRSLFVYLWDLALLPMAVTLGLVVPTVFMSLPFIFRQSAETHFNWIAFWQAFPLWTVLILDILHNACYYLLGSLSPQDAAGKPTTPGNGFAVAVAGVYEFGLTLCAVTHVPIAALSLLPAGARSALASAVPARYASVVADVTFARTFVPAPLSATPTVDAAAYGGGELSAVAVNFLQYDLYTGNAALLLWALHLHVAAAGRPLAKSLEIAFFWSLVGGPVAAALALLWDRDQVVTEGEDATAAAAKTK